VSRVSPLKSSHGIPINIAVDSASDAYAGYQLFHILEQHREALEPRPPRPYHAELGLPIRLASGASISTVDENTETVEPEEAAGVTTTVSTTFAATVRETLQVEVDGEYDSIIAINIKSSGKTTQNRPKDARVVAAESWLADYRSCKPQIRAAPSAIRAYRIWYTNSGLDPQEVAKLLRQPPLQTNTVVSYILETIKLEKLPFDNIRLRDEVLGLLPREVLTGRYKCILQTVERASPTNPESTRDDEPGRSSEREVHKA
jgi:exonuclease 3'-5' domain-containing protein 2